MHVLTIKQPWAWLIFYEGKDIENRGWRTHIRGRVAIHTSAKNDPEEWVKADRFITKNKTNALLPRFEFEYKNGIKLWTKEPKVVTGAIIGTVEIVDCVKRSQSPWFEGKYGFVLQNPILLENPIPAKGQLGFWEYDIPEEGLL